MPVEVAGPISVSKLSLSPGGSDGIWCTDAKSSSSSSLDIPGKVFDDTNLLSKSSIFLVASLDWIWCTDAKSSPLPLSLTGDSADWICWTDAKSSSFDIPNEKNAVFSSSKFWPSPGGSDRFWCNSDLLWQVWYASSLASREISISSWLSISFTLVVLRSFSNSFFIFALLLYFCSSYPENDDIGPSSTNFFEIIFLLYFCWNLEVLYDDSTILSRSLGERTPPWGSGVGALREKHIVGDCDGEVSCRRWRRWRNFLNSSTFGLDDIDWFSVSSSRTSTSSPVVPAASSSIFCVWCTSWSSSLTSSLSASRFATMILSFLWSSFSSLATFGSSVSLLARKESKTSL